MFFFFNFVNRVASKWVFICNSISYMQVFYSVKDSKVQLLSTFVKMVREIDPAWEHSVAVDGNRLKIKCNLCNKTTNGGITRFKQSTWPMSRAMWQSVHMC